MEGVKLRDADDEVGANKYAIFDATERGNEKEVSDTEEEEKVWQLPSCLCYHD